MQTRRTVRFTGHVQGVGFRWTTRRLAGSHPVTGFVMNLPDGRVEMVAEGTAASLNEFLAAVRDRFDGHITDIETSAGGATGEFAGFEIRYTKG